MKGSGFGVNWFESLCELYRRNEDIVGEYKKDKFGNDLILVPIYHSTLIAQITVYLNLDGDFLNATTIARNDALTLIPVTEESSVRTRNCAPHPLCDGLKYVAGDYDSYFETQGEKNFKEFYKQYISKLEQWRKSPYTHPKVDAIYEYLKKQCLVKDLIECGCLILGDNGKVRNDRKIGLVAQPDAAVRFCVIEDKFEIDQVLDDEKCWKDRTLFRAYICYARQQNIGAKKGLSYATGAMVNLTYNNPKKIRSDSDSGKLISFGDSAKKNHMLFEGLFPDVESALHIGLEESHMAYNALKWIIRKQGETFGDLTTVFYIAGSDDNIPSISDGTQDICGKIVQESMESAESDISLGNENEGTYEIIQRDAELFASAMKGYEKLQPANTKMRFLAFKSATPGRLALVENHSISTGDYMEKIKKWHEDMAWIYRKWDGTYFYGIPSLKEIATILYGEEIDGGVLKLVGNNTGYVRVITNRLISCILYGDPLPKDIINRTITLASKPQKYKSVYNWQKVLNLACACVRKNEIEHGRKERGMELDRSCRDRSYLYGRLLAIADRIEYRSYEKDIERATNAKRYMTAFSQRPFRTWQLIREKIRCYEKKLKKHEWLYYERQIDGIMELFQEGDFELIKPLDGMYLLGYSNELRALRTYKKKQEEIENE